jgi:hypothetical protein
LKQKITSVFLNFQSCFETSSEKKFFGLIFSLIDLNGDQK